MQSSTKVEHDNKSPRDGKETSNLRRIEVIISLSSVQKEVIRGSREGRLDVEQMKVVSHWSLCSVL